MTLAIEFMFQIAQERSIHCGLAVQGGGTLGVARAERLRQLVARRNVFSIDARLLHAIGDALHVSFAYGICCLHKVKSYVDSKGKHEPKVK